MKKNLAPKYVTEATFKEEMKNVGVMLNRLDASSQRHDADIKDLKETVIMVRDEGRNTLRIVQDIASRFEEADRARLIHLNQLMEFRPAIEDHEKRLVALEKKKEYDK